MESIDEKIICPSSRAKAGSQLLGIRQADGTVAILPQPLPVDAHFLATASSISNPEQRFRFANKCVEGGCRQWNGKACSIAERITGFLEQVPFEKELAACAIRPRCRWHLQSGDDACRMCSFVVTEITEQEALDYISQHPATLP